MVERDFTPKGILKSVTKEQRQQLKGYLPFYSVDTKEEAEAIIELALQEGELVRQYDGSLIETTLRQEQTLENLALAGSKFAELHRRILNE